MPMAIANMPTKLTVVIRFLGSKSDPGTKTTVEQVKREWNRLYPHQPFVIYFMLDEINAFYEKETRMASVTNAAMLVTIFVSCLGVFGSAMFSADQKIREIGIRKVFGATIVNITTLLTREVIALSVISVFVTSPLAL